MFILRLSKKSSPENFQVLVLLPEKGLSEQIAKRFKDFFQYELAFGILE